MVSKRIAAAAALLLIAGSSGASAQSAVALGAQVSVMERAGAEAEPSSALNGTTEWILAALSLAIIIFAIIHFSEDQNNSNSP